MQLCCFDGGLLSPAAIQPWLPRDGLKCMHVDLIPAGCPLGPLALAAVALFEGRFVPMPDPTPFRRPLEPDGEPIGCRVEQGPQLNALPA